MTLAQPCMQVAMLFARTDPLIRVIGFEPRINNDSRSIGAVVNDSCPSFVTNTVSECSKIA
jgi:hypothetical protein